MRFRRLDDKMVVYDSLIMILMPLFLLLNNTHLMKPNIVMTYLVILLIIQIGCVCIGIRASKKRYIFEKTCLEYQRRHFYKDIEEIRENLRKGELDDLC